MRTLSTIALLSFVTGQCLALEASIGESEITFTSPSSDSITVSIAGPQKYNASFNFNGSNASIDISEINQGTDGVYNFDAVAITAIGEEYTTSENGRQSGIKPIVQSETASGHFRLEGGSFVFTVNSDSDEGEM